jgi:hypothetical protein
MLLDAVKSVAVYFADDVTISNIEAAYADLGAALKQDAPVLIDISGVTETDLTFVQLIEAARLQAAETRLTLALRHPATGAVLEVLQRGGFLDDEGSSRAKFWLQGATAQ